VKVNRVVSISISAALFITLLTLAACGGSSTPTEPAAAAPPPAPEAKTAPTDTPAPAPTDTPEPAPTDTPEPAPTDTPEPSPTDTPEPAAEPTDTPLPSPTDTPEPASASPYDAAMKMAGSWVGEWNNLTFGSSGSTTAEIDVREDGTATITFDLNGNVFGLFDPPPITFEISFDADGLTYEQEGHPLLGDLTLTVGDGAWSLVTVAESAGIALGVEGTLSPESIESTYTVGAPDGSWSADGTFELHRP